MALCYLLMAKSALLAQLFAMADRVVRLVPQLAAVHGIDDSRGQSASSLSRLVHRFESRRERHLINKLRESGTAELLRRTVSALVSYRRAWPKSLIAAIHDGPLPRRFRSEGRETCVERLHDGDDLGAEHRAPALGR